MSPLSSWGNKPGGRVRKTRSRLRTGKAMTWRGWTHDRGYVDMPGTPLYPFGYGLSYSKFEYSNLRIDPAEIHPAGSARVSVDVKNIGDRTGVETVELYLHEAFTPVATPVKQLR